MGSEEKFKQQRIERTALSKTSSKIFAGISIIKCLFFISNGLYYIMSVNKILHNL